MQSKRKIIVNQRKEQINVIKIILTDVEIKFNKAIDSSKHPQVRKGRVRENILNLLSQQPYSLTDLSRIIKVSKPTISYHLSDLLKNGIIEISGTKTGRGGFRSKLFVLKYNNNLKLITSSNDSHYFCLLYTSDAADE